MVTLEELIARLNNQLNVVNNLNYKVEYSRVKELTLSEIPMLPIIYVGYLDLNSKNPTIPIEHDIYNLHGEDLVQTFQTQIVTTVENFPTVWRNVFKALIAWNPKDPGLLHTSLTYKSGGMVGLENSRMWWLDRWSIGFPTLYTDV